MTKPTIKRIVSGIQPTGQIHLGNYLGAIQNWAALQDAGAEEKPVYFIADLHAITQRTSKQQLSGDITAMTAALLACGIDPEHAILFNQSQIHEHSELAWILMCTARIGWLNRMTQFKSKAGDNSEKMSVGLYGYPVLQAADVLLYQASHVPVGQDQKQHLELVRDIAAKFNKDHAPVFELPQPLITGQTARIKSLRDPARKMSKSDEDPRSRIDITDSNDAIAAKIRKALTDSEPFPETSASIETRPGAENLITIMQAVSGQGVETILGQYGGQTFGPFKADLTQALIAHLEPVRNKYEALIMDQAYLKQVLRHGAEHAREIAEKTMQFVHEAMGLKR